MRVFSDFQILQSIVEFVFTALEFINRCYILSPHLTKCLMCPVSSLLIILAIVIVFIDI